MKKGKLGIMVNKLHETFEFIADQSVNFDVPRAVMLDNIEITAMFRKGRPYGAAIVKDSARNKVIYKGDMLDGFFHGVGALFDDNSVVYDGQWEHGREHGQGIRNFEGGFIEGQFQFGQPEGVCKMSFGDKLYEGEMLRGKPHGKGMLKTDRYCYTGEFQDGLMEGHGKKDFGYYTIEGYFSEGRAVGDAKITFQGRLVYVGEVDERGAFQGHGTVIREGGRNIEGNFNNMILDTQRVKITIRETTFEGRYANQRLIGIGKLTGKDEMLVVNFDRRMVLFPWISRDSRSFSDYEQNQPQLTTFAYGMQISGGKVFGEMRNRTISGKGIVLFENGERYEGTWRENQMHGVGKYSYRDLSQYVGEFRDGKKHGSGILRLASGMRLKGRWKNDKLHGRGFVLKDGVTYEMKWENGIAEKLFICRTLNCSYLGEWLNP
jgi:hypothetical protein